MESENIRQLRHLIDEAMELLDDVRGKFALFENQRYHHIKAMVEQLPDADTLQRELPCPMIEGAQNGEHGG
jgi:hypothetical protein